MSGQNNNNNDGDNEYYWITIFSANADKINNENRALMSNLELLESKTCHTCLHACFWLFYFENPMYLVLYIYKE